MSSFVLRHDDSQARLARHGSTVIGLGGCKQQSPPQECWQEVCTLSPSSTSSFLSPPSSRSSSKLSSSRSSSKVSSCFPSSRSSTKLSPSCCSTSRLSLPPTPSFGSSADSLDMLALSMNSSKRSWAGQVSTLQRSRSLADASLVERKSSNRETTTEDPVELELDVDRGVQLTLVAALTGCRQGRPLAFDAEFGNVAGLKFTESGDLFRPSVTKVGCETLSAEQAPDPWLAAASGAERRRVLAEARRSQGLQVPMEQPRPSSRRRDACQL